MPKPSAWGTCLFAIGAGAIVLAAGSLWPTGTVRSAPRTPLTAAAASEFPENADPKSAQPVELQPTRLNLQVGETLVYDIHVNGVPAGKTTLQIRRVENFGKENPNEVWVAALETRSNRAVSLFYEVRDKGKTLIDMKGGFSRFYNMELSEGDFHSHEKIDFNYDIGCMEATYERSNGEGQWRARKIVMCGKTLDPLAAIYYLRSIPLDTLPVGGTFDLPICADRRVWQTRATVTERGTQTFGALKDRAFVKIEPEVEFKGLFERKGRLMKDGARSGSTMEIWIDAKTGVPLKMSVEIPIGPAEVTLSEHANSPLDE